MRRTSSDALLNTQIHNPRSSEVKRESKTTTEVAAQKTASHTTKFRRL